MAASFVSSTHALKDLGIILIPVIGPASFFVLFTVFALLLSPLPISILWSTLQSLKISFRLAWSVAYRFSDLYFGLPAGCALFKIALPLCLGSCRGLYHGGIS